MIFSESEIKSMADNLNRYPVLQLGTRFSHEYQFLYDHHDTVAGYRDAVDAGEEILASPALSGQVHRLAAYRRDIFTSGRELAALAWAFSAVIDGTPDPVTKQAMKPIHEYKTSDGYYAFDYLIGKGLDAAAAMDVLLETDTSAMSRDDLRRAYDDYVAR